MRRSCHLLLALYVSGLLLGCTKETVTSIPGAVDLTGSETGHYCGMLLVNHSGPKGQIHMQGRDQPYWFSSVRDTFSFTLLPEEPKQISAIYVTDMAGDWQQAGQGNWIEARNAWFVLGSDAVGGMGGTAIVPFAQEQDAMAFVAKRGGKIVRFDAVSIEDVLINAEAEGR